VCVVGSLNMDLVVRAPRIPLPGETVLGGGYRTFPGGKGANQAAAAARMGAQVSLIGCVGDDVHGPRVRQALEQEGIDLSGLAIRPNQATGLALITVAEGGENAIVVAPGANADLSAEHIGLYAKLIDACDVLLLQLEVPNQAVIAAAQRARAAGAAVILNAAPARALSAELLKLVDVIVVNRGEAARILGLDPNLDPARLALRMPELGPLTAILTLGSMGGILAHRGRPRRIPSLTVKAIDTVGAGDAFCGALAAGWGVVHRAAQRRDVEEFAFVEQAVIAASVAGALAASKQGAIPAMPTKAEVQTHAAGLTMR